jgi:hypothetical protein
MKKYVFTLVILSLFLTENTSAGKYFWVGNGGNWTDVNTHWATTSGGSSMHTVVPGPNDTVFFDTFSFTQSGEWVYLDTLVGECAMMDWSGIDDSVEFLSGTFCALKIHGSCILSQKLIFDFFGDLIIHASGTVSVLDFKDLLLRCDLNISSDSTVLLSKLNLPDNHLNVIDGSLNTNNKAVTCRFLNTDYTRKKSLPVAKPRWYSNETLTVNGSIAVSDSFDFRQNGPVYFYYYKNDLIQWTDTIHLVDTIHIIDTIQMIDTIIYHDTIHLIGNSYTTDTSYINMYNNIFPGKVIFSGSKKMFLCSQLVVGDSLNFTGGGKFYTKGYAVSAGSLCSNTSLDRTIDLSTSTVTLNGYRNQLYLRSQGLIFKSDSAKLIFTYAGADTVRITTGNSPVCNFKEVHLPSSNAMIYNSFNTSLLALGSGSNIALARGITINIKNMTSAGDCGHYNYIKAFCPECPLCENESGCGDSIPVFNSGTAVSVDYLKLRNIKARGAVFTANNSFNEGNTPGWTINQPTTPNTLYWVGHSGHWNDPNNWSATPGGAPQLCIPTRATDVIFDDYSFNPNDSVIVNEKAYCKNMTWTNLVNNGMITGKDAIEIAGDLTLTPLSHLKPAGGLVLRSTSAGPYNINAPEADIDCNIAINSNGEWKLADTLCVDGKVILTTGTLNLNSKNLRCNALITGGDKTRTLDYSNSIIYLKGADTVWRSTGTYLTLNNGLSEVQLFSVR